MSGFNRSSSSNFFTPKFQISHPHLIKPKEEDGKPPKWQCAMVFDFKNFDENDKAAWVKMKKAIEQVVNSTWPGGKTPARFKKPIRDGKPWSDNNPSGFDLEKYPEYEGKKIINTSSTRLVNVKDARTKQVITNAADLYPGCVCIANVNAFTWHNSSAAVPYGVSIGLQNVFKVKDGDPFAGRAPDPDADLAAMEDLGLIESTEESLLETADEDDEFELD